VSRRGYALTCRLVASLAAATAGWIWIGGDARWPWALWWATLAGATLWIATGPDW
jgi:hypothetical protein